MTKIYRLYERLEQAGLTHEIVGEAGKLELRVRSPKHNNRVVASAEFDPRRPNIAAREISDKLLAPDL